MSKSIDLPRVSILSAPLQQYNLAIEYFITGGDIAARVVTLTDSTPNQFLGIPLYTGSDQEGANQANDPPLAYDICAFRDFMVYGNTTEPTRLFVTITGVGSPSGIQLNDTISFTYVFQGTTYTGVYTAKNSENQAARQFEFFTDGTNAQNITNTANSLIRVINYDLSLPIHAILISGSNDLPGQMVFEGDYPSIDTFTVTASAHATAYTPTLTNVVSTVSKNVNQVFISKAGMIEAVPILNFYPVGDSSSPIYRTIALRDYVIVIKSDGIYKIVVYSPSTLSVLPFDLTTKNIGPDTVVKLNSSVYMLSNQGIVSISDGGVEAKSIPIDDELNYLIGSNLDALTRIFICHWI